MQRLRGIRFRNVAVATGFNNIYDDESSLPVPPSGMVWVKDEDTGVFALMPIPRLGPSSPEQQPADESRDRLNSQTSSSSVPEEDWELVNEDNQSKRNNTSTSPSVQSSKRQISQYKHSVEETKEPDSVGGSFVSARADTAFKELMSRGSKSYGVISSFNSGLGSFRNVASVAASVVEDISTLASLPSIASGQSIGSNNAQSITVSSMKSGVFTPGGSTSCIANKDDVLYLEHVILPSDTLQGICLSYKISVSKLRRVNRFTGNSLLEAPKRLIIPITKANMDSGFKQQDVESDDYKIYSLLADYPQASKEDIIASLRESKWDLDEASGRVKDKMTMQQQGTTATTTKKSNNDPSPNQNRIKKTEDGRGESISFKIAVDKNVAWPTQFIRNISNFASSSQTIEKN